MQEAIFVESAGPIQFSRVCFKSVYHLILLELLLSKDLERIYYEETEIGCF